MRPPLESLRILEACVSAGSFARAAERLCLTPAAVSLRIRTLEADLGQSLFETLAAQQRDIPFVFVGQDPGAWFDGPYSWLSPPFAAFQVIEALGEMMAATSAAMQASFDLATADLMGSSAPNA